MPFINGHVCLPRTVRQHSLSDSFFLGYARLDHIVPDHAMDYPTCYCRTIIEWGEGLAGTPGITAQRGSTSGCLGNRHISV